MARFMVHNLAQVMVQVTVNRKSYIQMMEYEAQEAEKLGRIRVIVQDNSPIHRCQEVQQLWSKWESQNLYIFFLPKYCSEM
ncbi:transposase [Anabaena sp. PCC 7108]|uniref:transposase n=1 Tax=Anabaena sp. PCC 7108 TaxID=163908 RepID=UPI00192A7A22|nr:transposase [Anabaena sp. PCC 7108]